jgi:hypothetical protein
LLARDKQEKKQNRSPSSEALQFPLDSRGLEKFAMKARPYDRRPKSRQQNRTEDEIPPVHAARLQVIA